MEQLTIKHLAPYLPYGLTFTGTNGKQSASASIDLDGCFVVKLNSRISVGSPTFLRNYKPLLIPLSELKNIDNYTLIQFIKKETGLQIDHELDIEVDIDKQQSVWMPIPKVVEAYNILLQYHFDVFDLIGKGLALNKLEYVK